MCAGRKWRYSDSLRARRSGDRIPVGVRFSAPVQTGRWAHPFSCTMGTGSFLEVKRLGRGADHPPPYSAEVKERVELYFYFPSGPSWPVLGWAVPLRSAQLQWLCQFAMEQDGCSVSCVQQVTRSSDFVAQLGVSVSTTATAVSSVLPKFRQLIETNKRI